MTGVDFLRPDGVHLQKRVSLQQNFRAKTFPGFPAHVFPTPISGVPVIPSRLPSVGSP